MTRFACAALLLISWFAVALPAQVAPSRAAIDSFARAALSPRIGSEVGSASLVVVQRDSVVYLQSFGLSQPGKHVAASPIQTIYQVGSNSKLFVATAAMQLVEQGRLDLNIDINTYLKDFQVDGRGAPVTMAQLLTHTSGIDDRKLGRTQSPADGPLMPLGEFFRRFPPRRAIAGGTELNYSGNAMALAAHVVEEISGESFDRYAQRHIFQPLGMSDATFQQPLPDSLKARRASMPGLPPLIAYPAGGLAMTAADMGRFIIAMLNGGRTDSGSILQPETVALMQAHHFPADSTIPGIGYGFFEASLQGHRAVLHTGDYQHQSVLCLFPGEKLGFFLVVNPIEELRAPLLTSFVSDFAGRFLPRLEATHPPDRPLSPEAARHFTGYYRDDAIPHSTIERFFVGLLFGEGDARMSYDPSARALMFQPPDADPVRLDWLGQTRFRTTDPKLGAEIQFILEGNRATGFFAGVGALGAYTFRRIPSLLTQGNQFGYLLVTLGLFSLWLIVVLIRLARLALKKTTLPATERFPLWLLSATSFFGAGGFLLFSLLGMRIPSVAMMTGVPAAFYALPLGFSAACLAAILLPWTLMLVWQKRIFSSALRLLFTLTALAGILFIPFCWYWRLLGLRI